MKKSICHVCLLLLILSKCFSLDYSREQSVSFRGTEEFTVVAWGSMLVFLFPVTWPENHDFNWNVSLSADGNNKLCYEDSNKKKIFVKKGTTINVQSSFSGSYSGQINSYIYKNGRETSSRSFKIDEYTKIEYKMSGNSSDRKEQLVVEIYPDDDTPSIKIDGKVNENIYYKEKVEYSVEDSSVVCVCKIGDSGKSVSGTLEEDGAHTIFVEDIVGNVNEKTIFIDKINPTIKVFSDVTYKEEVYNDDIWFNGNLYIKYEDSGSGVLSKTEDTYSETGKHTLFVKDKAGNESTRTIKIDNEPPTVTGRIGFELNNGSIEKIKIEDVKGEDEHSGIKKTWKSNGTTKIGEKIIIEDRKKLNTYQIKIGAEDNAGNQVERLLKEINIPPVLNLECKSSDIKGDCIESKINIEDYNENKKYYEEIKLRRIIYVSDEQGNEIEVTEENFSNYFAEAAKETWKEITEEKVINADEIKNGIYTDKIKTSSGFGHKKTGYILSWGIEGIDGIREESEEVKIETANSEGNVKIQIIGKEDDGEDSVLDISFIDGKAKSTDGELKIPADGSIYIAYTVEDKDSEPYEIEVREKVKVNGRDEYLIVAKEGFLQKGNTGYSVYGGEKNPNDYAEGVWFRFSNPEYLAYNKVTCLVIRVKEGYGSDAIDKELGEIYLKAEPVDLGGFKLQVCKEADYNYFGITASPFQNVQIEVEGKDSITWDFGDDCVEKLKKIVTHAWKQSPERKGSVSEYILTLTTKETEEQDVEVPIHIVDTKAGALYGNEEWIGEHEILGPIIVPNGKTLIIGRETASVDNTNILCIEDINEKYMGSIEVSNGGKLKINNGTEKVRIVSGENTNEGIVEETEEDISYWKGIRIKDGGKAEIENTEIMGSKRGVAVENGASLIIKESLLSKNEIGLHVFGSCEIEDVEISENKEYGIKEENLCEVNIYGEFNKIRGNAVDWYDWNDGVLTEEEITNRE